VGITMKSFNEYLTESKKTYEFKIKIAGDLAEGFKDKLKGAMERYSIVKMDNGKRLPIAERHLDFPELENTNVTVFNVEINYPTTTQVLENYISQVCGCEQARVRVRTANQEAEQAQEEANKKEAEKPLIGQCDPAPSNHQDLVGEKKISSFLKDLASVKHGGEQYTGVNDQLLAKSLPTEKVSETPESGASISPIGSKTLKGKK
jgi:hypothetical protein